MPTHAEKKVLRYSQEQLFDMVADVARLIAQRFKFRQAISGGGTLADEVHPHIAKRFLQLRIGKRVVRVFLEGGRSGVRGHWLLRSFRMLMRLLLLSVHTISVLPPSRHGEAARANSGTLKNAGSRV